MSTPPDPAAAAAAMVTSTATATAHIAPKADADANVNGDPQALPPHHPELTPTDTYQVDSSEFDSGSDAESLPEEEYDALVQEGFTEDETAAMVAQLKEQGLVNFLRDYLAPRADGPVNSLRKLLLSMGIVPPRGLREPGTPDIMLLPFAKVALSRVLRRRAKLPQYNTVDDAVELLRNAKRILVLSGAGISTSCGIPDFRSATGLYASLQAERRYELDDPQQMFDIAYFREHPEVFYSFAKQIYPSNFVPSPCHRWIKLLEDRGVLLRNYTQNIDTLESLAGVQKVLQCHGSFKTASCLRCKAKLPGSAIEEYIMEQRIPYCPTCREVRDKEIEAIKAYRASVKKSRPKSKAQGWDSGEESEEEIDEWGGGEPGIIKPDITFFGQALDSEFDESLYRDREQVDLLVIIGTSLKVAPVSEVLSHIPHSVPQILINLTPVTHVRPDINLLGDADSIVTYLSHRLGWAIPPPKGAAAPLAVPPEDAVWVSGEDEWAHVHMLRSRDEVGEALSGQTVRLTVGGESDEEESGEEEEMGGEEGQERPEGDVGEGAGGDEADGESEGEDGGDGSLAVPDADSLRPSSASRRSSSPSDRPAKRSRMGSPASARSGHSGAGVEAERG